MGKGRLAVPAGVTDWSIAVAVAALLLGSGLSGPHPAGDRELLGSVLLAVGGLVLAVRRRAPLVVLAVAGLSAVGYQAAGFEVLAVSCLVAVYGAVRAGHRAIMPAATLGLLVVLHLTALVFHDGPTREAAAGVSGDRRGLECSSSTPPRASYRPVSGRWRTSGRR